MLGHINNSPSTGDGVLKVFGFLGKNTGICHLFDKVLLKVEILICKLALICRIHKLTVPLCHIQSLHSLHYGKQ